MTLSICWFGSFSGFLESLAPFPAISRVARGNNQKRSRLVASH